MVAAATATGTRTHSLTLIHRARDDERRSDREKHARSPRQRAPNGQAALQLQL